MKDYEVRKFGLAAVVAQSSYLYEKLAVMARAENMPLSMAAGIVGEMRRKLGAEWWGQSAPQKAECPHYAIDDLDAVEDLLTAARVTDSAVVAAMANVESLTTISRGIELSSVWVQSVAAKERTGERFCAACGEYVYDYMGECPCGAKALFRTGDFC